MSRINLTNKKSDHYNFKNKVDLSNRETFGYFAEENPLNNELFVYVNNDLYWEETIPTVKLDENGQVVYDEDGNMVYEDVVYKRKYEPVSLSDYNTKRNVNDIVKKFWDDRVNRERVHRFYDLSLFGRPVSTDPDNPDHPDDLNWKFGETIYRQPALTEYIDYKGNIFEFYQRLSKYIKEKIELEVNVKDKLLDWFDPNLFDKGLTHMSNYIFNPKDNASLDVSTSESNSTAMRVPFNEYFRMDTVVDITGQNMFVESRSNSIRPSRIYYKHVNTHKDVNLWENKYMFPMYLGDYIDLNSIMGRVRLDRIDRNSTIAKDKDNKEILKQGVRVNRSGARRGLI